MSTATAAALYAWLGVGPRDLDIRLLHSTLLANGVYLRQQA